MNENSNSTSLNNFVQFRMIEFDQSLTMKICPFKVEIKIPQPSAKSKSNQTPPQTLNEILESVSKNVHFETSSVLPFAMSDYLYILFYGHLHVYSLQTNQSMLQSPIMLGGKCLSKGTFMTSFSLSIDHNCIISCSNNNQLIAVSSITDQNEFETKSQSLITFQAYSANFCRHSRTPKELWVHNSPFVCFYDMFLYVTNTYIYKYLLFFLSVYQFVLFIFVVANNKYIHSTLGFGDTNKDIRTIVYNIIDASIQSLEH